MNIKNFIAFFSIHLKQNERKPHKCGFLVKLSYHSTETLNKLL